MKMKVKVEPILKPTKNDSELKKCLRIFLTAGRCFGVLYDADSNLSTKIWVHTSNFIVVLNIVRLLTETSNLITGQLNYKLCLYLSSAVVLLTGIINMISFSCASFYGKFEKCFSLWQELWVSCSTDVFTDDVAKKRLNMAKRDKRQTFMLVALSIAQLSLMIYIMNDSSFQKIYNFIVPLNPEMLKTPLGIGLSIFSTVLFACIQLKGFYAILFLDLLIENFKIEIGCLMNHLNSKTGKENFDKMVATLIERDNKVYSNLQNCYKIIAICSCVILWRKLTVLCI